MKVRASVKRICDKCKVVRRRGVVRVICTELRSTSRGRDKDVWHVLQASIFRAPSAVEIGLTYIYGIGRVRSNDDPDGGRRQPRHPRQGSVRRRRPEDQPGDRGAGRRRRRSPQGDLDEHQAADGNRLLPRAAAPPQPAGARPADADQRAHAQGPAQGRDREEEDVSRKLWRRANRQPTRRRHPEKEKKEGAPESARRRSRSAARSASSTTGWRTSTRRSTTRR